jgi:hypothetical protein
LIFIYFLENEIFFMGNNYYGQSGIGHNIEIKKIIKINYFEKKNIEIKKINCGGNNIFGFTIFLTSSFLFF